MSKFKEMILISALCLIIWIIVGFSLGKSFVAFSFGFWFFYLYNLPLIPWVSLTKCKLIEKFALITVIGLAIVPTSFFIIGVLGFKFIVVDDGSKDKTSQIVKIR